MACKINKNETQEEFRARFINQTAYDLKNRDSEIDGQIAAVNKAKGIAAVLRGVYGQEESNESKNIVELEELIKKGVHQKYKNADVITRDSYADQYVIAFLKNLSAQIFDDIDNLYNSLPETDTENIDNPTFDDKANAVINAVISGKMKIGEDSITNFINDVNVNDRGELVFKLFLF